MIPTDKFLLIATEAAKYSGEYLRDKFGKKHKPEYKSDKDIGLEADKESEKIIIEVITKTFPQHNIYSEETGFINNTSEFTWFIDPLDGTNNFYMGIGYFSISIALVQNTQLLIGIVFNPITNQLFMAEKEKGAFLNDNPIDPSNTKNIRMASLSFIKGHRTVDDLELNSESVKLEHYLASKFRRTITMWAPSLDWCLLASGGIDVLISFESELEDQYAGTLIAAESGIKIINFLGKPYQIGDQRIVACNLYLVDKVLEILNGFQQYFE
jgi:myo-inositol-1(or 4)-monophosphatase